MLYLVKNYMSRIGKLPIKIPESVIIIYNKPEITIKGKFGELRNSIPDCISIKQVADVLIISIENQTSTTRALHGLYRSLINNMVLGVSEQFKKCLILQGVGYRAAVQNELLILSLGYSHSIELKIPVNISIEIVKNTTINLTSINKEKLGLFVAKIRAWRPPEPYKGKGILYKGEIIKRKVGKSGKK
jgi:large subunit ribosomal protein L6